MLTRRQFLAGVSSVFVFPIIGANHKEKRVEINVSSLNIYVPMWLFDNSTRSLYPIKLIYLSHDIEKTLIIVKFLDGRQQSWPAKISAQTLLRTYSNKTTRPYMFLKRLISFTLDAIYKNLYQRNNKKIIRSAGFKAVETFREFQAEEILDVVPIGAIYKLLSDLEPPSILRTIRWDPKSSLFTLA